MSGSWVGRPSWITDGTSRSVDVLGVVPEVGGCFSVTLSSCHARDDAAKSYRTSTRRAFAIGVPYPAVRGVALAGRATPLDYSPTRAPAGRFGDMNA